VLERLLSPEDYLLLRDACVLHDIGYSSKLAATRFHALDGARYLEFQGLPTRLCALVAHHSCAYKEAELCGFSGELARWSDEQIIVRDALWWADMTTTPNGECTNVFDRIEEIQKRYGPEDLVTFFVRQAMSDLVAAVERTEARLKSAGIGYAAK
jgi:hypothetical protein